MQLIVPVLASLLAFVISYNINHDDVTSDGRQPSMKTVARWQSEGPLATRWKTTNLFLMVESSMMPITTDAEEDSSHHHAHHHSSHPELRLVRFANREEDGMSIPRVLGRVSLLGKTRTSSGLGRRPTHLFLVEHGNKAIVLFHDGQITCYSLRADAPDLELGGRPFQLEWDTDSGIDQSVLKFGSVIGDGVYLMTEKELYVLNANNGNLELLHRLGSEGGEEEDDVDDSFAHLKRIHQFGHDDDDDDDYYDSDDAILGVIYTVHGRRIVVDLKRGGALEDGLPSTTPFPPASTIIHISQLFMNITAMETNDCIVLALGGDGAAWNSSQVTTAIPLPPRPLVKNRPAQQPKPSSRLQCSSGERFGSGEWNIIDNAVVVDRIEGRNKKRTRLSPPPRWAASWRITGNKSYLARGPGRAPRDVILLSRSGWLYSLALEGGSGLVYSSAKLNWVNRYADVKWSSPSRAFLYVSVRRNYVLLGSGSKVSLVRLEDGTLLSSIPLGMNDEEKEVMSRLVPTSSSLSSFALLMVWSPRSEGATPFAALDVHPRTSFLSTLQAPSLLFFPTVVMVVVAWVSVAFSRL